MVNDFLMIDRLVLDNRLVVIVLHHGIAVGVVGLIVDGRMVAHKLEIVVVGELVKVKFGFIKLILGGCLLPFYVLFWFLSLLIIGFGTLQIGTSKKVFSESVRHAPP